MGGGPLLLKLVNPIKVARSRPANEFKIQQLLIPQANPQMRAAHTAILGKSDSAVRKELPRFNLIHGCLDQLAKLPPLLLVNGGLQILNFRCALADEDDQSDIGDPSHPGITNQLRIERQETLRLIRIAAGRRFPVDEAFRPVELADRIDIRKEL